MSPRVKEAINPSLYSVFCGANRDAMLGDLVSLAMTCLANTCTCVPISTCCRSSQSGGGGDTGV